MSTENKISILEKQLRHLQEQAEQWRKAARNAKNSVDENACSRSAMSLDAQAQRFHEQIQDLRNNSY